MYMYMYIYIYVSVYTVWAPIISAVYIYIYMAQIGRAHV